MEDFYEHLLNTSEKMKSFIEAKSEFKSASTTEFIRFLLGEQSIRAYLLNGRADKNHVQLDYLIITENELLTIKHSESSSLSSFYVTNSFDRTSLSNIKSAEYTHHHFTLTDDKTSLTHNISLHTSSGDNINIKLDEQYYITNDGAGRNEYLLYRFINALNRAVLESPYTSKPTNSQNADGTDDDYNNEDDED